MTGRVLIVDDDATVLRTLATSMTRNGHTTVSTSSVAAAIARLASESFDIVLVDLHIGPDSGLEVVRACRARSERAVIMMLTGEDDDEVRAAARASGADLVLAKPVAPAELRAHVAHALAQRRSAA